MTLTWNIHSLQLSERQPGSTGTYNYISVDRKRLRWTYVKAREVMGSIFVRHSDFFFVPHLCQSDQFTRHISLGTEQIHHLYSFTIVPALKEVHWTHSRWLQQYEESCFKKCLCSYSKRKRDVSEITPLSVAKDAIDQQRDSSNMQDACHTWTQLNDLALHEFS